MTWNNVNWKYSCFIYYQFSPLTHRLKQVRRMQSEKTTTLELPSVSKDMPVSKKLRSGDILYQTGESHKLKKHTLPPVCIFCKNVQKYRMDKHSKKRGIEPLQQCETIKNQRLLDAAHRKEDEELLRHIQDKDLVAIEVSVCTTWVIKYYLLLKLHVFNSIIYSTIYQTKVSRQTSLLMRGNK